MIFGQTSFRRILLSRLLLVSVPVLLLGVYATYRKARSAFLETARQNLTESAIRKADSISQSADALRASLAAFSDAPSLKLSDPAAHQALAKQFSEQLPFQQACVQMVDLATYQLTANTCDRDRLGKVQPSFWLRQQARLLPDPQQIYVQFLPFSVSQKEPKAKNQLELLFSAPIYDGQGILRYALSVKASLLHREKTPPGSLEGNTIVISQAGVILAHPYPERLGQNIADMPDAERLQNVMGSAIAGEQRFLHLFSLQKTARSWWRAILPWPVPSAETAIASGWC
ncbi:MAG: hypothetical protein HC890_09420 [Chloroflexaceae bacterium]|nr:hypothetical protein [Chloroflexaceae bacterium]